MTGLYKIKKLHEIHEAWRTGKGHNILKYKDFYIYETNIADYKLQV